MCPMATSETPIRAYRAPMTNDAVAGHGVAAVAGLMAAVTLLPADTGTGWLAALAGTSGALGLVVLNLVAVAVRAHTHTERWAVANAALVGLAFVGALLCVDAGRELRIDPTPTLWVQLFIALICGSVLVAKERLRRS